MPRGVEKIGRTRFLETAGFGLAAATMAGTSAGKAIAAAGPPPAATTPLQAIQLLQEGNQRFIKGTSACESLTARRLELTSGQNPFAIVLGCSDSRVPLETIFDQEPGNLFVVRVAGNFVSDAGLGSIEYGVAVLKSRLIVVLGHSSCGAVDATIKFVENGTTAPGHIMGIVKQIEPAVAATKGKSGNWLHNATVQNVRDNVAAITQRSSIVADAVKSGTVLVTGGVYDLHSGQISPLAHMAPSA
ncbi:MAG: carbonic anhydrase [Candidatus Eremiobacteraeota bacterium]|nr:carbonic anhydrase [Candidatus Eremiobacteraeota bacterium]